MDVYLGQPPFKKTLHRAEEAGRGSSGAISPTGVVRGNFRIRLSRFLDSRRKEQRKNSVLTSRFDETGQILWKERDRKGIKGGAAALTRQGEKRPRWGPELLMTVHGQTGARIGREALSKSLPRKSEEQRKESMTCFRTRRLCPRASKLAGVRSRSKDQRSVDLSKKKLGGL